MTRTIVLISAFLFLCAMPAHAEQSPIGGGNEAVRKEIEALKAEMRPDLEKVKAGRQEIKAIKERLEPSLARLKTNREKMKALRAKAAATMEKNRTAAKAKIQEKLGEKQPTANEGPTPETP